MTSPLLIGYRRVSRQGDRDELRSPELQRQAIERYASGEGLRVEMADAEIDVSGSKPKRAVLDGIIARVKAGEVGGIVVSKLDRLSRLSPRDRVMLFDEIESAGGVILSASEQLDPSTPEGRFAREVFLGIARMQWEKYASEFENAKAGAIELGIPVNNRPPAGYVKGPDRRLVPDPETAGAIRELFEMRANGAGPVTLAEHLERNGVTTSAGSSSWTHPSIYRLISNPVYKGTLRYGRDDRHVKVGAHDAIVDPALWQAAQRPPRNLSRVSERSATLLSGLIRCAACRYAMQGTRTGNGKRVYRCMARHSVGRCPSPARFYADEVEADVVAAFWSITEDIEARGSKVESSDSTLEALREAFDRAQARVDQLSTPEAQDALGETYLATFRLRRAERDAAAGELGRARAQAQVMDSTTSVETLRGAWERMTVPQRRELLGLRLDCVAASGSREGERRIVVYPKGTAPADLPRRGFKPSSLTPFSGAP